MARSYNHDNMLKITTNIEKILVIPAKAGIYLTAETLDARLREHDEY